jgi:hypothetical protein
MLEDKEFFNKEVTSSVANLIDTATIMLHNRTPVKKIYEYLLTHSKDYRERYMSLFLFGIVYQGYKEDNHLK